MAVRDRSGAATPLAQLGKGFATLGVAEIGARLIAFAATAWVSQVLGAAQFGIISFALAALLYGQRVVSWDLEAVGIVEVAERDERAERATGTILTARLLCALAVVGLVAVLARWVLPSPDGSVLLLYTAGLACVALNVRFVYLMRHETGRPALARLIAEGVAAAVIVSAVHAASDVHRVPLGYILGEGVAAAFLLSGVRAWSGFRHFDLAFALRTARRASPLVLSSLLGLLVFNLDLILLRFTWGSETAGYYAAAYAIVSLLLNLGVTFYSSVLPGLSRVREDRDAFQALYGDASALLFTLMVPFVIGGVVLARPLTDLVFGGGYAPSAGPLAPLLVAAGLTISRFVPLASVVALGRRREALWINGTGAAVNVVLNVMLIPRHGLMGAATSAVATDVVRLVVAVALSRRAGLHHGHVRRLWRPAAAVTVMGVVAWLARGQPVALAVAAGGVVYAAALGALGVLRIGPGLRVSLKA
jgi:O-antigen/teichoic acid export membrane protein